MVQILEIFCRSIIVLCFTVFGLTDKISRCLIVHLVAYIDAMTVVCIAIYTCRFAYMCL